MIMKNFEKELESYRNTLENSYSDNAWKYFDYEDIRIHVLWNGYKCSKCNSECGVKNKEGLCVKCLVIKEKISVIDKILKKCKEVEKNGRNNN